MLANIVTQSFISNSFFEPSLLLVQLKLVLLKIICRRCHDPHVQVQPQQQNQPAFSNTLYHSSAAYTGGHASESSTVRTPLAPRHHDWHKHRRTHQHQGFSFGSVPSTVVGKLPAPTIPTAYTTRYNSFNALLFQNKKSDNNRGVEHHDTFGHRYVRPASMVPVSHTQPSAAAGGTTKRQIYNGNGSSRAKRKLKKQKQRNQKLLRANVMLKRQLIRRQHQLINGKSSFV
jgi:hypothetical protein